MPDTSPPPPGSSRGSRRWGTSGLPNLTFAIFLALALLLWINAAVNTYRFNVVEAVLGSVPLLVVLVRGAVTAHSGSPR